MTKINLLHGENRPLSERQKLSTGKSLVDLIPSAGELDGDSADMAVYENDITEQIWLHRTDGKLLRAIEQVLMRIRQEEFSICEKCGQPIATTLRYY